jgi:hypothetical protein
MLSTEGPVLYLYIGRPFGLGEGPVLDGDGNGFGVGGASREVPKGLDDGNVKPPEAAVDFPSMASDTVLWDSTAIGAPNIGAVIFKGLDELLSNNPAPEVVLFPVNEVVLVTLVVSKLALAPRLSSSESSTSALILNPWFFPTAGLG